MAVAKPQAPQFTLRAAIGHFARDLRGDNKSARTVETYVESVERFASFAETQGVTTVAAVDARLVRAWLVAMASAGNSDGTRFNRFNGLKAFLRWAVHDGQLERHPMEGIPPPKPMPKPVPLLSDAQLRALLKACSGSDFESQRDTAIVRLLVDTGMRRSECANLKGRLTTTGAVEGDVDLDNNVAVVIGKGRKIRACPFGVKSARAIGRYLRARYPHPYAALPNLWLGRRGALTDNAMLQMLRRRGKDAGIPHLFTHQLRHTWASTMLSVEGLHEGDVVRLGGWSSTDMLRKYGAAAADERAQAAYRTHAPGDRL
jgi:site-specific recombinase XerD